MQDAVPEIILQVGANALPQVHDQRVALKQSPGDVHGRGMVAVKVGRRVPGCNLPGPLAQHCVKGKRIDHKDVVNEVGEQKCRFHFHETGTQ